MKKKYRKIVTHRSVHLDEIVAIMLLKQYGSQKYPGVDKAEISYVNDDPIGTDEQFDTDGLMLVGCGRGRFDDKDKSGKRKPGVCSATLVAKDLGIHDDPRLKTLLDEVLVCDSEGGTRVTQLAAIINTTNRCFGGDQKCVIKFAYTALDAIIKQLAYKFMPNNNEWGSVEFFNHCVQKRGLDNERAVKRISLMLEKGSAKENESVTELDFILRAMQRVGYSHENMNDWAECVFKRMYEDQLDFQRTFELVRPDPKTHRGQVSEETLIRSGKGDDRHTIRAIFIRSDGTNAHAVASCLKYDLIVCRRSTGHTQVFVGRHKKIRLRQAVAMIRWLEIPEGHKKEVVWENLMVPGEYLLAPKWYYSEDAGQLFNGTLTHDGVPASEIHYEALKDVFKNAFHAGLVAKWKEKRGIKQSFPSRIAKHETSQADDLIANKTNKVCIAVESERPDSKKE